MVGVLAQSPRDVQRNFLCDTDNQFASQWAILAGLRFVMSFIVLVSHTRIIVGLSNGVYKLVNAFGSHAAVAAFFIISGYSIASSLQRDASNFYSRRFWRIYPVYLVVFVLSILPFTVFGSSIVLPHSLATPPLYYTFNAPGFWNGMGILLFLQGICIPLLEINSPIWSIGVEVIYYALAPWFRKLNHVVTGVMVAISALIYGSSYLPFKASDYAREHWGFSSIAWLCFWLIGFELYRSKGLWRYIALLLPVGLLCLNNECGGILTPFTLAAATLLLIQAPMINIQSQRLRQTLYYLGDLSYPLYLIHVPVFVWVWMILHTKNIAVHIALSILVSAVVLALVDKPLRSVWKKIGDLRSISLLMLTILSIAGLGLCLEAYLRHSREHIEYVKLRSIIQANYDALIAAEKSYDVGRYHKVACSYMSPEWVIFTANGQRINRTDFLNCYDNGLKKQNERFLSASFQVQELYRTNSATATDRSLYISDTTRADVAQTGSRTKQNRHHYIESVEMETCWTCDGGRWKAKLTRMLSQRETVENFRH